jgi:uncharacterized RDD family membrane protein YckC
VDWYYIQGNQQVGPVTDTTLSNLAMTGAIAPETLLWRAGMQDWQPARIAAPELVAVASAPDGSSSFGSAETAPGMVRCSSCGGAFPSEDVIQIGPHLVCAGCKPVYVQRMREGVPLEGSIPVQFGGFWIRFAAKFIDGIVLLPVSMGAGLLQGFLIAPALEADGGPFALLGFQLLTNAVVQVVTMAYVTFFVGRYGATPGKMVCRLRVVTADLQEVTYMRAFARYWGEFITGLTFTIGYIIAAFDSEKRALHDYICGTRVIRV